MELDDKHIIKFSHKIRLSKISNKIGIPENQIISLLENSGFDDLKGSFIYLNDSHLKILSKAYVKSIKSYYDSSSKNYFNFDYRKQKELRRFFSKFVNKDLSIWSFYKNDNTLDKLLGGKLDSELIEIHFDRLVYNIQLEGFFGSLTFSNFSLKSETRYVNNEVLEDERVFNKYKHFIKLKIRINNLFNDIRSELQSILICCHYYIFSDEENHDGEVIANARFSRFMIIPREALKIIYYLKFHKRWIKTLKFS